MVAIVDTSTVLSISVVGVALCGRMKCQLIDARDINASSVAMKLIA